MTHPKMRMTEIHKPLPYCKAAPVTDQRGKRSTCFTDDEWSPLEEVVVGRAEASCFPSERCSVMSSLVPHYYLHEFRPNNPFPAAILEKADQELENFCQVLESYGVKVHRPELVDWNKTGGAGGTSGYTGSMPRDGLMVVGDTIFIAAFSWACRRHEIDLAYGAILSKLEKQGYRIVRPPKPPHPDTIFDVQPGDPWVINNSRIAFDAADFIRTGSHVVGQLSNTTNQKGIDFVRAHLPPGYELIILRCMNEQGFHIEPSFMPIGPGTALYNPKQVKLEELLRHKPLNTWRLLPLPYDQPWESYPPPYTCSPHLNMNVLMLDEKRVFCEQDDTEMHQFFREMGMEPIVLPFKHVHSVGGSFHCATVDLRRRKSAN